MQLMYMIGPAWNISAHETLLQTLNGQFHPSALGPDQMDLPNHAVTQDKRVIFTNTWKGPEAYLRKFHYKAFKNCMPFQLKTEGSLIVIKIFYIIIHWVSSEFQVCNTLPGCLLSFTTHLGHTSTRKIMNLKDSWHSSAHLILRTGIFRNSLVFKKLAIEVNKTATQT